tara:strand:+ start:335 stop:790 length:456 start_codon:yes stop_codon:yes gene_type:complete
MEDETAWAGRVRRAHKTKVTVNIGGANYTTRLGSMKAVGLRSLIRVMGGPTFDRIDVTYMDTGRTIEDLLVHDDYVMKDPDGRSWYIGAGRLKDWSAVDLRDIHEVAHIATGVYEAPQCRPRRQAVNRFVTKLKREYLVVCVDHMAKQLKG